MKEARASPRRRATASELMRTLVLLQAQKRRLLACPVLYRNGAPFAIALFLFDGA
jgi:hypothetical protein